MTDKLKEQIETEHDMFVQEIAGLKAELEALKAAVCIYAREYMPFDFNNNNDAINYFLNLGEG